MGAVTSLLACARNLNATVIHVRVGSRPGFPDVEWHNLHPVLEARPDEPVVSVSMSFDLSKIFRSVPSKALMRDFTSF